jgi:S-adenosylmethionine hydrolase
VRRGDALALAGSTGRIEIAVRNGNAAAVLSLQCGDAVRIV